MECKKCNGTLPEIQGIVYCPFCKTKIGEPFKSSKYKEYFRIHHELVGYDIADNVEEAATKVIRSIYDIKHLHEIGKLLSNRIDTCGSSEIIECWNDLCMGMINAILKYKSK